MTDALSEASTPKNVGGSAELCETATTNNIIIDDSAETCREVSTANDVEATGCEASETNCLEATDNPVEVSADAADSTTSSDAPNIEQLIAEAEQRGYLRGRNESIKQLMAQPAMYEQLNARPHQPSTDSEVMILNNMRRSVWD